MPLNDRRHTIPDLSTDQPSWAGIFDVFETINDIVPVANATERAAAATSLDPTPARPLFVWRTDAAAGRQLEVTTDGTTWRVIAQDSDTDWQTIALGSNWTGVSGYTPAYRVRNGEVHVKGAIQWVTGVFTSTAFTLPAGARPSANIWLGAFVSSSNGNVRGELLVQPSGAVSIPAGYYIGTPAVGNVIPLSGSFPI